MRRQNRAAIAVLLVLGGIGCAAGSRHRSRDDDPNAISPEGQADQKIVVINGEERAGPPPLRNDPISAQPGPSATWLPGHWLRDPQLNAWVWVPGRWR